MGSLKRVRFGAASTVGPGACAASGEVDKNLWYDSDQLNQQLAAYSRLAKKSYATDGTCPRGLEYFVSQERQEFATMYRSAMVDKAYELWVKVKQGSKTVDEAERKLQKEALKCYKTIEADLDPWEIALESARRDYEDAKAILEGPTQENRKTKKRNNSFTNVLRQACAGRPSLVFHGNHRRAVTTVSTSI